MKKIGKIQIKQIAAFVVSCITMIIIGFFTIIMIGIWQGSRDVPDIQDNYAIEQQADSKQSKPKYVLKEPEDKIKENITSVVTEETDSRKSSRLEDIMGVLSSEISE